MAIKCGNCSKEHNTAAEVRDCYTGGSAPVEPAATEKQKSLAQALGRERVRLSQYADMEPSEYGKMIDGMGRQSISDFIGAMLKQPHEKGKGLEVHPEVLAGRFALRGEDGVVRFYELKDEDVHGNPRRMYQLIGAPGDFTKKKLYRPEAILGRIAEDVEAALKLYGDETETCGLCGSPLTNETSRARGIGPKCLMKL